LKRLPIDVVKIDRSFVKDLDKNPADGAIVAAIIDLADRLGFGVVAEGVETTGQANMLGTTRCQLLQGYLFGRHCTPQEFEALVTAHTEI